MNFWKGQILKWEKEEVGGEWEPDHLIMVDNAYLSMSGCWYSPN